MKRFFLLLIIIAAVTMGCANKNDPPSTEEQVARAQQRLWKERMKEKYPRYKSNLLFFVITTGAITITIVSMRHSLIRHSLY